MKRNRTPLPQQVIDAATGATLLDVAHVTLSTIHTASGEEQEELHLVGCRVVLPPKSGACEPFTLPTNAMECLGFLLRVNGALVYSFLTR